MDIHRPQARLTSTKFVIAGRDWLWLWVSLILSGVLLGLAFPRPGWWPLAYIALVPAGWVALTFPCAKRLALTAWIVGSLWWLVMIAWLIPVTLGGYIALSIFLGLYLPGSWLLLRWLNITLRLPATLALPLAWVSLELVRGNAPSGGFGWFALGQSQAAYRPDQSHGNIVQLASLLGEQGVSLLLAMVNGYLIDLAMWFRPGSATRVGRSFISSRRGIAMTGLAVGVLWLATGWYGWMATGHSAYGDAKVIAVVQTNIPQNNKDRPTPATDQMIWDQLVRHTQAALASDPKPQLIVWPETMLPGPMDEHGVRALLASAESWSLTTAADIRASKQVDNLQQLASSQGVTLEQLPAHLSAWMREQASYREKVQTLARQNEVYILVGAGTGSDHPNGRRANSVYMVRPDGSIDPQRYDKINLVPFGEYIPWVDSWPWLKKQFITYLSPYAFDYTLEPGWKVTRFHWQDGPHLPIATSICFEEAVARLTRRMIYDEQGNKVAHFMINLTNDGWFVGTDQQLQHVQIAAMRCIELRVPTARSVNTGVSGFINQWGKVGPLVQKDGQYQRVEGWVALNVPSYSAPTFFGWAGQWPMWGWATFTGLLTLVGFVVRKRNQQSK